MHEAEMFKVIEKMLLKNKENYLISGYLTDFNY
jgi:hypothetical protein